MNTVVFHRDFKRFQGGHLKVFHYFEHVRSSPVHDARVQFTRDSLWDRSNPWWGCPEAVLDPDETPSADVRFLAGMDWLALPADQRGASPVPIVNLIQGFSHTRPQHPLYGFLGHAAIRVCVSAELQQALQDTGAVNGPIFTVPIGLDLERLPPPRARAERDLDCVVLALKDPPLGRAIAKRVSAAGRRVELVERPLPRQELLAAMARARVSVHLPAAVEGAYLPALESMALGALVVCPDCVGNRSFCRDGETCLVPKRSERALAKATLEALSTPACELTPMLAAAQEQSRERGLASERARFLEILDRAEDHWRAA
jgi:glycosyltransferase involved in cell wall biosynthesis